MHKVRFFFSHKEQIAIMNILSIIWKQCLHLYTLAIGGLESHNYQTWCVKMVFTSFISVHDVSLTRLAPSLRGEWGTGLIRLECACELFACLPLSVMKTFLLMARVWEAKPILQFLVAVEQILFPFYSSVSLDLPASYQMFL